jgi:DNA mismatch repair protein MutS2
MGVVLEDHEVAVEESAVEIPVSSDKSRELRVGDRVRVLSLGSIGTIDQIKGDEVQVRVGSIHLREKLSNLELRRDEVSTRSGGDRGGRLEGLRRNKGTELHLHSKSEGSPSELNLIGKTTDEAVDLADKFLDHAFLEGQSEVRIIHGHGTGALRKAIAEFLGDHPHVARFIAAPQDKGGSGATIVELRQ